LNILEIKIDWIKKVWIARIWFATWRR